MIEREKSTAESGTKIMENEPQALGSNQGTSNICLAGFQNFYGLTNPCTFNFPPC